MIAVLLPLVEQFLVVITKFDAIEKDIKTMNIRYTSITMIAIILFACSSATQEPILLESPQPAIKTTSTQLPITITPKPEDTPTFLPATYTPTSNFIDTSKINKTVLNFEFPFEPTIGYVVDLKSKELTTNLICALGGEGNGDVLDMNNNSKNWGTCDKDSMTLDIGIPDEITVTVILGGIPFINEETKLPSLISEEQIEFTFEVNLK